MSGSRTTAEAGQSLESSGRTGVRVGRWAAGAALCLALGACSSASDPADPATQPSPTTGASSAAAPSASAPSTSAPSTGSPAAGSPAAGGPSTGGPAAGPSGSASGSRSGSAPANRPSAAPSTVESPPGDALIIEVTESGGDVTPNGQKLDARVGQQVQLEVLSDRDDVIHAHTGGNGYELQVTAGVPTTGTFTLDSAGSFEVESHELDKVIVILNAR